MSLQIPIQKDIGEYEEKIVGRMSLRTLVCVSLGFASAVAVGATAFLVFHANPSAMTFPVMCACLPFWLAGFWRPYGMRVEEFLPLLVRFHIFDQRLFYVPCAHDTDVIAGPKPGKPDRRHKRLAKKKGAELYEPKIEEEDK